MTGSHGCDGRRRRSRIARALAASGFCLGFGLSLSLNGPALACHITHDKSTTAKVTPAVAATSADTPTQALQKFMKVWDEQAKPNPHAVTPTSMMMPSPITPMTPMPSPPAHPAAQTLTPSASSTPSPMPSVSNWHQGTASTCMPPTPPACSSGSPTQTLIPPTPLKPPSALLPGPAPTPAPEPSTILTAVALAGAFAWRRRATRDRA